MRVLIIGCGYIGTETGRLLVQSGHEVYGIRRSPAPGLSQLGIHPIVGDITRKSFWDQLNPEFGWVINCVSSSRGNADVYRDVYLNTTRLLMDWLQDSDTARYVYTSSTSVLGQSDASWVDESTPVNPLTDTARILVETEECLMDAAKNRHIPTMIVRLSGIYGPDRGFLFRQFMADEAELPAGGDRYMNMIHRDDAASGIVAALNSGKPGEIYHLTDDCPVQHTEFFQFLCKQTSKPMPKRTADDQSKSRKRAPTDKKVSNKKAREQLGWNLRYPTFRDGLAPEIALLLKDDADS